MNYCIVLKYSHQYKHYEYARTSPKMNMGRDTENPKIIQIILSRCP